MTHDKLSSYGARLMAQIRSLAGHSLSCDELVRHSFQILRNEIAFDAAAFLFYESRTSKITGAVLENIDSRYLGPLLRCIHSDANPVFKIPIKDSARRGSDLLTRPLYVVSPFYQNVLKPNRLFFSLFGSACDSEGTCFGQYYLLRSENQRNFSRLDLSVAEKISPVLGELLSNHKDTGMVHQSIVEIAKQRSCPGVLVYDDSNRMIYQNSEAQEIEDLIRGGKNSHSTNGNGLSDPFISICRNLNEHIAQKGLGLNGSWGIVHVYSFGGESFCFRGMGLTNLHPKISPLFLVLIDRISKDKLKIHRLLGRFRLSPRELAVVKLILLGKTNKEIANEMGIGQHTIKDHVRRVMNRMGVTTRTGIISQVFGITPPLSHSPYERSHSSRFQT